MIAAPVQCDVDGVPKGSHLARVLLSSDEEHLVQDVLTNAGAGDWCDAFVRKRGREIPDPRVSRGLERVLVERNQTGVVSALLSFR